MFQRACFYSLFLWALLVAGLLPASALARDIEGAGDHPLVERIAGSHIVHMEADEFRRVTLPTGPWDQSAREYTDSVTREGEWLKLVYAFDDDDTSALRVHRSFLQVLPAAGFEILFEGVDTELLASGAGRSASFLTAHPSDRYKLTHRGPINQRQPVYYLIASHQTEPVHVAISTFNAAGNPSGVRYAVNVITEEEMVIAMDHQPLSAGEMEQGLISEGRVAIQDILFGFDSDEILAESAASLATIAELLNERTELGLLVVGHTDDVGDFDYNLRLSMSRASAVVNYLVNQHGIDASRLNSAGAGMMAPIASNRTEQGRAQNRRVELVEIRR